MPLLAVETADTDLQPRLAGCKYQKNNKKKHRSLLARAMHVAGHNNN
jgi:hypothetical protein